MPYIKQSDRQRYKDLLKLFQIGCCNIETKGDLEYCIYWLMEHFMSSRERRYSNLHDCVYAAQHCADEFRRRNLDKREDEALNTNGDIYDLD